MVKKITCIECPKGCSLFIDIENCRVVSVKGSECPKGEPYAVSEVENPMRILTATVVTKGLSLKMLPVKTAKPIPKERIQDAMAEIKRLKVDKPVHIGDIIVKDLLGLGTDLIATRDAK